MKIWEYGKPAIEVFNLQTDSQLLAASPNVQPGGGGGGTIIVTPPTEDDEDDELVGAKKHDGEWED